MKFSRFSLYVTAPFMPGHINPASVVVRNLDLTTPPEESPLSSQPGSLMVLDTFDMPDGTELEVAIPHALERREEMREDEDNMATLYHWTAAFFRMVSAGGVIMTERPAPLSIERIQVVLTQLCVHPQYDDHRINVTSDQGGLVRTESGRVIHDTHPPRGN